MSMDLRERILAVMDRKDHWAWPRFTKPGLTRRQLAVHFRHEYKTYVRDFPVLLARLLGQGPPDDVRRALAINIYEEQTGGLSLMAPHPELFLRMMDGLGIPRAEITAEAPRLARQAERYRDMLHRVSSSAPWVLGAAVLTIFVEGSARERATLAGSCVERPVDEAIGLHPLVQHYGCPPSAMLLVRAHRAVEGAHRRDAWAAVLGHAATEEQDAIVSALEKALALWLDYRDSVVQAMDEAG